MIDLDKGDTRLLIATCKEYDLLRNQAAYVLATALIETNWTMKPVEEAYFVKGVDDAWRKRNLRYYPWHGRGFIQLTWERNYLKAREKIGVDLIADPTLAMDPDVSAEVTVRGSKEGWFTGRKLSDYITLKKSNFKSARRIVNGTDRAAEFAEQAELYDAALLAEGYGVESDEPTQPSPDELLAAYMAHPGVPEGSARHRIAGALMDLE